MPKLFSRNRIAAALAAPDDAYIAEAMEPRLLLSADALGIDAGVLDRDDSEQATWDAVQAAAELEILALRADDSALATAPPLPDLTAQVAAVSADPDDAECDCIADLSAAPFHSNADDDVGRREIVFLDAGVDDGATLLADLAAGREQPFLQVVLLDADRDGVAQIAEALAGLGDIDAIHILSHGAAGQIQLGSATLSTGSLDGYTGQLNDWGSALAGDGDILIYGCDLAADEQGRALVDAIGVMTGADVAASVDPTGHAAAGGDWDLEYRVGVVDVAASSPGAFPVWQGTLGSITVTTTSDVLDGDADTSSVAALALNPGSDGFVSLREAIIAANSMNETDTILLSSGTYRLDLTGGGPDEEHGDLDVNDTIHIVGAGASSTIIDGNLTDRIFEFGSDSDGSSISGVRLQNGDAGTGDGGAILTQRSLTITDAELTGNTAKNGGAILANDTLTLERVTIAGSSSQNGGGVLLNAGSDHSLTNVTLSGNTATTGSGGGLDIKGTATLTNVTIANNSAWANGGGLHNGGFAVTVSNTLIADNTASGSGNDAFGAFTSDGSNLVEDISGATGFGGGDITGVDPNLQALANDGGEIRVLALGGGSAAIDNGDSASAAIVDARGYLRGDGSPDIGAYEAGSGPTTTATYLDKFLAYSWAGDDGTLSWTNSWQEIGESDGPGIGNVYVWDVLGQQGLNLWAADNIGLSRQADLSGADWATLSFDWAMFQTELGDQAVVQISTDGTNWDTLDTFDGPLDHTTMQSASYDISAYIDNDTQIRFLTTSGFSANDVFFADNVRIEMGTASTATPSSLWMSTTGNVSGSGAPGLNAWENGEVIELGHPNLAFEPGTTDGTFSSALNLETLAGTDIDVDALHFVTRNITLGTTNTVDLQPGDLLFSTNDSETIQSLVVDKDDVMLFRPDTAGDYSSGTFSYVFRGPIGGTDLKAFSLIEQDTVFGDTTLQAGDFLFSQEVGGDNDVYVFHTVDAGDGTTAGTTELLISGSDVGITDKIFGLELIEADTTLGDETLAAGELLVSVDNSNSGIGTSGITADEHDIFRLQAVKTTAVTGTSVADAALLTDGTSLSLDGGSESLDALTVVSSGAATAAPSSLLTVTTAADVDDGDTSSVAALITDPGADGEISLREAIIAANATAGLNTINFDIAGSGPHVISLDTLLGALPTITGTVVIDGTSEPDFSGAPVIQIDGTALSAVAGDNYDGLVLGTGSDGSTLRGLSITGFTDNGFFGEAIDVQSGWNTIAGNYIGLTPDGTTPDGNRTGIKIWSGNNTIGGTDAADRNVIVANTYGAVAIHTDPADNNRVVGNYIGVAADGTTELANAQGVVVWDQAEGNVIGGVNPGEGNRIVGGTKGVNIDTLADDTAVLGNTIYGQTLVGIDLDADGLTANDLIDADSGPNDLLNFPELNSVSQDGPDLDITFDLDVPAGDYRIEFYENPNGIGPSGHGGGQVFLGAVSVTHPGGGSQTFMETLAGVTPTAIGTVTATATEDLGGGSYGSTSEFSAPATTVVAAVQADAPATENTDEDLPLVFSVANGNAVSVSDATAADTWLRATLTVTNGVLDLATTAGLTFESGADGTSAMTISGSESAINAALDGLQYTPTGDYNGPADLQVTVDSLPDTLATYTFDNPGDLGNDDSQGGANDGTVVNATAAVDGTRGNVLSLDAAGGADFIQIPGQFGNPTNVTLAAWVNVASAPVNGGEVVTLGANVGLRVDDNGDLRGFVYNGSTWEILNFGTTLAGAGWHHIAYAVDDAGNVQKLFLDGAEVASGAFTGSISYTQGTDSFIGKHGDGSTVHDYTGLIDDVRIYDRALSASEIQALANDSANDTAAVSITVDPVNDAPMATNLVATAGYNEGESGVAVEDIVVSDVDVGEVITATLKLADTSTGSLTANDGASYTAGTGTWAITGTVANVNLALANLVFNPVADNDTDTTIDVTIDDGDEDGSGPLTGTITLDVTPVNDEQALTVNNVLTVDEGSAGNKISVAELLTTDIDNTPDQIAYTITALPSSGTLYLNAGALGVSGTFTQDDINNGRVTYEHDGSENNSDGFSFSVDDGAGSAIADNFAISINLLNDNTPVADAESFTVAEGGTATEADLDAGATLLDGDTDLDAGDTLTVNTTPVVDVSHGTLTLNTDGTFTYVHDGSENFTDSFTYEVSDGVGNTDTATVTITITPQSDPPTAVSDVFSVAEGSTTNLNLWNNDSDIDDGLDLASITIVSGPGNGSISAINPDGTVDYTHDGSETLTDSFSYRIGDLAGNASNVATVDLIITPQNDAPTIGNNSLTVNTGQTVVIMSAALSASDADDAAPGLTFTVSAVAGGQFELASAPGAAIVSFTQAQVAAGDVVFVDDGDAVAPSYSVSVSDGAAVTGPSPATIVFNPAPPTPVVEVVPESVVPEEPTVETPVVEEIPPTPVVESIAPEDEPEPADNEAVDEATTEGEVVDGTDGAPADDEDTVTETVGGGGGGGNPAAPDADNETAMAFDRAGGLLRSLLVKPAALAALSAPSLAVPSFELDGLTAEIRTVLASSDFNDSLDRMRQEVANDSYIHRSVVGSSVAVTTGLSVGYVAWLVRGGVLLSTALSSLPAWQFIDPLPVLARTRDGDADADDDSLQSIIKEQSQRAAEDSGDGVAGDETPATEPTRKPRR